MNVHDRYAGLSGIEQMRALLASGGRPPIMETLQFDLLEVEEGRVVFAGTPGPHAYNPIGSIHGGYAATLLDSACGCALHTKLSATQAYTTLELKISYLRGMSAQTGLVRAEGTVVSVGRRVGFTEARLLDAQGKVLATASSTLLVIDKAA
jgi:uncharacterized protein (TIGR00369 family)